MTILETNNATSVLHDLRIVSREDEGRFVGLVHLLHQIDDALAGGRIEVGRRLVGEDDARIGDQRAGDRNPLALTAGEFIRLLLRLIAQTDFVDQGHDLRFPFLRRVAALNQEREFDVLKDAQDGNEVEALENEAELLETEARQRLVFQFGNRLPLDINLATGRDVHAADEVEKSRLPTTRGACHRGEFADVEAEIDPFQGLDLSGTERIDLGDAFDPYSIAHKGFFPLREHREYAW